MGRFPVVKNQLCERIDEYLMQARHESQVGTPVVRQLSNLVGKSAPFGVTVLRHILPNTQLIKKNHINNNEFAIC